MTLIDSNILIDIFGRDPVWWQWSLSHMEAAKLNGPLLINDVIYAETSIRYPTIERFDAALAKAGVTVVAIPREALFLAGKTFTNYRGAGGPRAGVLPDFFIGAHAAVQRLPLLTRDVRQYRSYFPKVALIAPVISP
ncbi:MAG TPA: type II toxin-antitoxin system VapC family toxin [Bradyrhizobium sp.]|nr:type II toxin-antitoxin system VapC family toxin [Bradyrhizobium sp.]